MASLNNISWSCPKDASLPESPFYASVHPLLEGYADLSETQRAILDCCAFTCSKLGYGNLKRAVEGYRMAVPPVCNFKLPRDYKFKNDLEVLAKKGFIAEFHGTSDPLIRPEFMFALIWKKHREGVYEALTKEIRKNYDFYSDKKTWSSTRYFSEVQRLFLALDAMIMQRPEAFEESWKAQVAADKKSYIHPAWITSRQLFSIFLFEFPFDRRFFNSLYPEMQKLYFELKLETVICRMELLPTWMEPAIRGYVELVITKTRTEPMVLRWIEYLLFRGDLAEVNRLLAIPQSKMKPELILQIQAAIAFFEGNLEAANQRFREAEDLLLQTSQKECEFEPFFEVLHILCSFTREDLNWNWIHSVLRRHSGGTNVSLRILERVAARLNDEDLSMFELKDAEAEEGAGIPIPFVKMLRAALTLWLGSEDPKEIADAIKLQKEVVQNVPVEFEWFRKQALQILERLEKLPKKAETEDCFFAGLVQFRDRWEVVLNAFQMLQKKANQADEEKPEVQKNVRLTWRFDYSGPDEFSLEAYEQIHSTRGWTAGKKVSLKRLRDQQQEIPYLTPQDLKIIGKIHSYFEYYSDREIFSFTPEVLPLLVDHPFIFSMREPLKHLTIQAAAPRLEVVDSGSQSVIQLRPFPYLAVDCKKPYSLIFPEPESNGKDSDVFSVITYTLFHQEVARLLKHSGLVIPKDRREQAGKLLEPIMPHFQMKVKSKQVSEFISQVESVENVEPDSRIHVFLEPDKDFLVVRFNVYPLGMDQPPVRPASGVEMLFGQSKDGKTLCAHRDFKAENENLRRIFDSCPVLSEAVREEDEYVFQTSDDVFQFFAELEPLVQEMTPENQKSEVSSGSTLVIHWPKTGRKYVSSVTTFKNLSLGLNSVGGWFEAKGKITVDQESIDLAQLLLAMEQTKSRFVEIRPNEFIALSTQFRDKLEEFRTFTRLKGKKLQIHPLAAPAVDASLEKISVPLGKLTTAESWKETVRKFKDADLQTPKFPRTFQGKLRDYQMEGFEWLSRLSMWGAGGCLADDMGLGKTIQALAVLLSRASKGPALIVAPTSVCANWEREIQRFTPGLKVIRVASYSETGGKIDRSELIQNRKPYEIVLTNYAILQREAEAFSKPKFATIVLDEAQAIKNSQTERTQAVLQLQGDFRFITTGTPIENNLSELWSLFEFINPGFLGTKNEFDQKFGKPIQQNDSAVARKQLKRLVKPFILRRFKSDVLTELPPKTEIQLEVELTDEERAIYEAIRMNALKQLSDSRETAGAKRIQVLAELMKLRRVCCDPHLALPDARISGSKLNLLTSTVQDLLSSGHKILVFSQFVDYLKIIAARFESEKIAYQYLDGSMTQKKRQAAIDAFQTGEDGVFLISLKAGGFGLNLTAADYVIHTDPWWNPAVENQASDRAHRIGQTRPVTIYKMITQNTIEEKIIELHQRKDQLAQEILSETGSPTNVSLEELLSLLEF